MLLLNQIKQRIMQILLFHKLLQTNKNIYGSCERVKECTMKAAEIVSRKTAAL